MTDRRAVNGSELRVGLIGCGKMGLHHLKAIAATGKGSVVGIVDPAATESTLEELRPLLAPDARLVSNVTELLETIRPDVVHIVTPPGTHAALAMQAIQAGCSVYVEKPFTPTKAEAEQIFALAAAERVSVCAGHQVQFEPPALAALDSLAEIGRVVHIESYFSFKMVRRTITPAEQVKDILPHAVYPVVDQLRAATGLQNDSPQLTGLSVDPSGDVYALLRLGRVTAVVLVTLNGRPVEHYQNIIGTNGSLRADYIAGSLTKLVGPGTGPGVLLTPFRRSWRTVTGATRGIRKLVFRKGGSYPGLITLIGRFYASILEVALAPLTPRSILDTVDICEQIGAALDKAEREHEAVAGARLIQAEAQLPVLKSDRPGVLVTGGTGLLGRAVVEELRHAGYLVRAVSRRMPLNSRRVPGVEYVSGDLARGLDPGLFDGIGVLVHCAAETAGGKEDHRRNSVDATRHVLESAARAGVSRAIHVSSLGILKGSREVGRPLDEAAPVDVGNIKRGPYVWGKAESELVAQRCGAERGMNVKVIRPGPLVDYAAFTPPGRLGRELGPLYVAIGPKRAELSVCDVSTAARVVRSYLEDFDSAPPMLNLVEAPAPSRRDLLARYLSSRPDLRVFWMPAFVLRALSGPLRLVQKVALGSKHPIDVAAAFASERYQTDLAAKTIARAGTSAIARDAR